VFTIFSQQLCYEVSVNSSTYQQSLNWLCCASSISIRLTKVGQSSKLGNRSTVWPLETRRYCIVRGDRLCSGVGRKELIFWILWRKIFCM